MREQPVGWTVTTLERLGLRIEAGLNVRCEERPPTSGERGLVKISAVTWGRFDEEQSKTLPAHAQINERHRIEAGDLLMSRANTIELVGSAVLVGEVQKRLYLSDKVLRLNIPAECRRWVHYALKSPESRRAIANASSGNQLSMRNISQDNIRSLAIPVAPLKEQQRIADKLDTVLARVDACRDRLARVAPLLKRFRQSVLAAATSGQLTAEWRATTGTEPTWPEILFGDVVADMRNGLSPRPSEAPPGSKILRISAVRPGRIDYGDHRYLEVDEATARQYSLSSGDLLFTRYNGSLDFVGTCALVSSDQPDYLYPDKLIRVRVNASKAVAAYLVVAFGSPGVRCQVENLVKSSAGQKGISGSDLKSTRLQLPTVEEQTEIVRRVETLFSYADRLEARLAAALSAVDRLTPALLAKAFRGELVPQDPADEPASELLRRLAQSRSTPAPQPRKRQTA